MAKILYVEDHYDIFELYGRWLSRAHHQVLHARNADAALKIVQEEQPNLILLDIRLGEFSVDGWEINRQLKIDPGTRDIPVICFSATAEDPDHRERAKLEGFVAHLDKVNVSRKTLIDCVAACLPSKEEV